MRRIGPAKILVSGAGITAPVEDWVDLGDTRGDVGVTPTVNKATGRSDQSGMTPRADAVWITGRVSECTAPLLDKSIATLEEIVPGAVRSTQGAAEALGLSQHNGAETPTAVAIVPLDEFDAAGDWYWTSEHTIWIPTALFVVVGPWPHALPDGDDAEQPYEVQIRNYAGDTSLAASIRDAGGIGTVHTDLLDRVRPAENLVGDAPDNTQVDLSWDDVATNEDNYRIDRDDGAGGPLAEIDSVAADVEAYIDNTVAPATTYRYQVRGTNASDPNGTPSNIVEVIVPA